MNHRFPIGTQYKSPDKHPRTMTVCDQMTLTNTSGEVVRCFYWAYSELMGQRVIDHDVCDTTIARNLIHTPETEYLWTLTYSDGSVSEDEEPVFMTVSLAMECNRQMAEVANPWRWESVLAPLKTVHIPETLKRNGRL